MDYNQLQRNEHLGKNKYVKCVEIEPVIISIYKELKQNDTPQTIKYTSTHRFG